MGSLSLDAARKEFEAENVYVNTASIGLPPRRALDAVAGALDTRRTGRAEAAAKYLGPRYTAFLGFLKEKFPNSRSEIK